VRGWALLMLASLTACQHVGAAAGPTQTELATAMLSSPEISGNIRLSAATLRGLRCRPFDEEPTEFACHFRAPDSRGHWKNNSAIVAQQGAGWVLLSLN
jgi:hypothetical protein